MRFYASSWNVCGAIIAARAIVLSAVSVLGIGQIVHAGTLTFGSGDNTFQMEFVTIGDTNNAARPTLQGGGGAVAYTYSMGKYEVSEDMISKYNLNSGIPAIDFSPDREGVNKAATNISWNEAARFVNWLNTSTNGYAAYNFTSSASKDDNITPWTAADTLDWDASNPYRSKRATFVLPSSDEWTKAAYYDPNKSGGAGYYLYAQGSDTKPTAVASGTGVNSAVYNGQSAPADITNAGGLNAYGLMAMGGNVKELEETSFDFLNNSGTQARAVRGFSYSTLEEFFVPAERESRSSATSTNNQIGFRVAMVTPVLSQPVPEPTSMVIFGLGALGFAFRNRKKYIG
jgi:sulfatase modifying factor 1